MPDKQTKPTFKTTDIRKIAGKYCAIVSVVGDNLGIGNLKKFPDKNLLLF